ncbi:MAG TPA: AraC family transcriptional regulator [Vicinamibacterales bacterium]|nr:AraC family transcriptional regulator [Vicinamibacterales bacterium]
MDVDVLSDVLRAVRLSGSVFFTAEFSSPWSLESPNPDLLAAIVLPESEYVSFFHILIEGECLVGCGSHRTLVMESGDIVVFPHGHPHTMRSLEEACATRLDHVLSHPHPDAVPRVSLGGGGRRARFICGYLNCSQRFAPLFDALPVILIVRRRTGYRTVEALDGTRPRSADVPRESSTWLGTTLRFTINEATAARPGNAAMLGRLTELMFVEIVREYMHQLHPGDRGWLAALRDPCVGRALRLLHEQPNRPWTVDRLAHEVAASRSALAQRFTTLLGESPMRYLCGWRMHLAKQLLRDRAGNIQTIAERVGYESEPAFNRAFKKATGRPPAAWRRMAARASAE